LPQTVGVLKPQTSDFYRLGLKGRKSAALVIRFVTGDSVPSQVKCLFYLMPCGMARMRGLAPAGESLSLLTKKETQRNHPEIARKPAVLANFEAPPKLSDR
jgi:hypothetical protein